MLHILGSSIVLSSTVLTNMGLARLIPRWLSCSFTQYIINNKYCESLLEQLKFEFKLPNNLTFHLSLAAFFLICSLTDPWMFLVGATPPDILQCIQSCYIVKRKHKIHLHKLFCTYTYRCTVNQLSVMLLYMYIRM